MRIISNAKAREGKNTIYRSFIAAYLWDIRFYGPAMDRFKDSKCSWGICPLFVYHGIWTYFTQFVVDLNNKRDDHIEFTALKKGCKLKTEQVYIMLY